MKKKGFTLIELLAVIVVLAIIAFILIPVIQDLIDNARYASAADSVLNYVHAANTQAAVDAGGFEEYKLNLSDTYELETEINDDELQKIKYSGKSPDYVYLLFAGEEKYVSEGHFCMWGYSIDYNFETGASKSGLDYCGNGSQEPEGTQTCDVLSNNAYDDTEIFKIKNVEDLVCVSELAKTKTFENKTIYLIKDIDFNEDSSYENPNNTSYGDINGNGEIEGLKTELITGSGFYPIGSQTVPFKGTFEGFTKSISNLMINRTQDNIGLFGYNQGKVRGFTISSNITGNINVGGVVGTNNGGEVNEIIVSTNIFISAPQNTYSNSGGVVGYNIAGDVKSVLVRKAQIESTNSVYFLGGIVGKSDNGSTTISGIVESGYLKRENQLASGTGWANSKIVASSRAGTTVVGYVSDNMEGGTTSGYNGISYTMNDEFLNAYDIALDTYIGGDNDDSGYYFDYENSDSSTIAIKRTTKNPITFTVKGKGTESDPYIIDNYTHYKEVTTLAGKKDSENNLQNYYLKLTSDINFEGKHYYALGTNANLSPFNIDGDMYTISNVSFNCIENCGLVFQNNGRTLKSIKLSNINIGLSNEVAGGLVGYNTGIVRGIIADEIHITGPVKLGGIVGVNDGGEVNEIIANVSLLINAPQSTYSNSGGIVGYNIAGDVKSALVKSVQIESTNSVYFLGGIVGKSDNGSTTISGIVESGYLKRENQLASGAGWANSKIVASSKAGTTVVGYASNNMEGGTTSGYNGISYTLNDEILNTYDHALDTWIGGDNDDDGYYFDYENDNSSNIVIKRTKDAPITFSLSGNGSVNNPYIIDNYQHYKEATTLAGNANMKFKFTSDIDFTGKHYYSLGTLGNPLSGDIDGDMHTIFNVTLSCADKCGLISENLGHTIEGLNLSNINLTSTNEIMGGLVGYNTGTVKGINTYNVQLTGPMKLGGVVGVNEGGTVTEISADTTLTVTASQSSSPSSGGIVGYNISGDITSVLVRNAQISSINPLYTLGGIVGKTDNAATTISGVVERGYLKVGNQLNTGVSWGNGKIVSYNCQNGTTLIGYASNNMEGGSTVGNNGTAYTLILPTTVTYTEDNNTIEVDSLTYYDSVGALDTVIGGDGDGSGYYLQYNNSGDAIIAVKSGTNSGTGNPSSNPTTPTIGEAIEETKVGDNPPTCVLERVISRDSGLQPVLTCTDEEGAPTIRSQWNVNKNATTNQFSDIGIVKSGTVNGNSKTVRPYWSTSDPISVPTRDTCYYFRFGAQDASGNWSYYVTSKCYYGFGRSND